MNQGKLGRYDIVRVLGRGAMGLVCEAWDPNLDRRVAIKTIKVENLVGESAAVYEARFRTEARSAARLQHANIVSVYDSGRDGDVAFLVMEFIQGEDLKHALDSGTRYSFQQSLGIVFDLLSALDYAHRQHIVHRDIKPANLLIESNGRVKLTDFGVARIQDSGEATRTKGSMVGTLKYMSPEQVQGQTIDARSDLFAAAIILYELLAGRWPFQGDSAFSIIQQIVGKAPAALSTCNALVPAAFDAVVARALAKSPEDRFGTAGDLAQALREASRDMPDLGIAPARDSLEASGLEIETKDMRQPAPAPTAQVADPRAALGTACASCGHRNPNEVKFCGNCGSAVGTACAGCSRVNPPGSKFCANCGRAIDTAVNLSKFDGGQRTDASHPPEAERRQITVLFCDLVGSTSLSHDLDPEDLRAAVRGYQDMAGEAITFFDGYVAQYLGDGILVYFGYPSAHEDDARRAVSTGLRIISGLPALNERLRRSDPGLRNLTLQVRVGVHTGLVVAGDIGTGARRDQLAIGETPNIAAHMQGLAQANTVLVSQSTCRIVEQLFEMKSLGAQSVKGLAQPMRVYEVRGESLAAITRSERLSSTGALAALVGRERQVEMLHDRWQKAEKGNGHVLLVSGEAGIGKSRLARSLVEHVRSRPHVILEARFSPYHQQSPFHSVADLLLQILGLGTEAATAEKMTELEKLLRQHRIDAAECLPVLGSILGLGPAETPTTMAASPEEQRQTIMESLLRILLGLAASSPVLLIFEDLHWADPSTVELIGLLVAQVPTASMFVMLTARPAFVQPWPARTYATQLLLEPFTHEQTEMMVKQLTGGKRLPAEILKQVIAKTDGVPLFAEELIRFVLESGLLRDEGDHYELAGPLPAMAIPSTLQDSLMARLDRLAPLKSLVQLAAAVGREFSYALLRAVASVDDATLRRQLAGLVEADLIYQRGLPPQATYIFKHALIQDAAYQALLKSTRRQYHRHIAEVMAERFPDMLESQPEVLAHHCTRAGLTSEAIDYWSRAGERALQRSAYPEAISHHSQALMLVADLPEGAERIRTELDLQVALAPSLDATRGVSSPEAHQVYVRAWALCREVDDSPHAFAVLTGLRRFYFVRGDLARAHSVAEQLLSLSQATDDPVQLVETHLAFGVTSLWRGDASDALVHLHRGMAFFEPGLFPIISSRRVKVSNPLVSCLAYGSWALWATGSPEQALIRSHQSVEYARSLQSPISLALSIDFAAALREFRGEAHEALPIADEGIALCREHGFTFWLGLLTIRRGWALSRIGSAVEGLKQVQNGLSIWRQTSAGLGKPFLLALHAETLMRDNRLDEARAVLEEARGAGDVNGEHFFDAEVLRLTGELHFLCGQPEEAEHSLARAIDLANAQGARTMALRAATSLTRNRFSRGIGAPDATLLNGSYGTFTEGFDAPDLVQARELLAALGEHAKSAPQPN